MLTVAAVLSLAMGLFVALFGEERRARLWFLVVCLSCTALCVGLQVELGSREWARLAARVNMTAALLVTASAFVAVRAITRLAYDRWIAGLLAVAGAVNLATVWLTDLYFNGSIYQYGWGLYVGANPRFIINPLLTVANALFLLIEMARQYRRAHPLDRNRAQYLFLSYAFLALSVLDYLPHFRINLFSGAVSGFTVPLFLATFGYACLRFRLVAFRELIGRAAGWFVTALAVACAYALFFGAARRWLPVGPAHVGAAIAALAAFGALGSRLPDWAERFLGSTEADFRQTVERSSHQLMSILDERELETHIIGIATAAFGCVRAVLLRPAELEGGPAALFAGGVVEGEVARRRGEAGALVRDYELLVPLDGQRGLLGVLALGRRFDNGLYSGRAIQSLRVLANVFALALSNARRAIELERQRRLDRYLSPQVVQHILGEGGDAIDAKQRRVVTVFFSDLKGFTEVADRVEADRLSAVLNEYLSEMAEIAFRFGGTLDKFIGDSVMIFFGAPVELEPREQAKRCVEMAIDMQRALRTLNRKWREQGLSEDFTSRIGIHTGEAVVGSFGSRNRVEYTAIGRTVNLASRLEGQCTPGEILVSSATWELVRDHFKATTRGRIPVKGFAELVEVFELHPLRESVMRLPTVADAT